jgi:hypothetical protein
MTTPKKKTQMSVYLDPDVPVRPSLIPDPTEFGSL